MPWRFDNTYARDLEGFYVPQQPTRAPKPKLVAFNTELADELGLDTAELAAPNGSLGAQIFSGNELPPGAEPIAQAYAGHQFGSFNPSLGDGRALLLGEQVTPNGDRFDIAFKGSGRTPFSRGGDGKAALGPVLREFLFGEAMAALGIPTTRALAAVTTGEYVRRERALAGAVLTRVAASHLRVGTFQLVASRGSLEQLAQLTRYAIDRHYPDVAEEPHPTLAFFRAVALRQAHLIAQWMSVGFLHGVMNTDNMTISGETIDYGPCAWLETYDLATVFSSIDTQGRYSFGNQPRLAGWNLARLGEALLPLVSREFVGADQGSAGSAPPATGRAATGRAATGRAATEPHPEALAEMNHIVNVECPDVFEETLTALLAHKLGLRSLREGDKELTEDWLKIMERSQLDYTMAWRWLADELDGISDAVRSRVLDVAEYDAWRERLTKRVRAAPSTLARRMRQQNPINVPRNHLVEEALAAAEGGDFAPFEKLLAAVRNPFVPYYDFERAHGPDAEALLEHYITPAPREFTASYITYCGT